MRGPEMLIVDAQVHIWGADTPERPWPESGKGRAQRAEALSKKDLLQEMNAVGVAAAVIVPPSWEGDRNDLALAAAQAYPDRFAVMGRLALRDPGSRGLVGRWEAEPGGGR